MRPLSDVIDQILEVSTNKELNRELQRTKSDIGFTAPELMHIRWAQVHQALTIYTPSPIDDETVTLLSIFSTKSEEEIREAFRES